MVLRGIAIGVCVCACGCAESQLEARMFDDPLPQIQTHAVLVPPVDTFWFQEAQDEATRPAPARARSISLGYVGNTPLTGGVMRDTPMPIYPTDSYVDYAPNQPCACSVNRGDSIR
jgi:hypothetical protein